MGGDGLKGPESGLFLGTLPSWVEGGNQGDWLHLVLLYFGLPEPKAGARGQGASSGEGACVPPLYPGILIKETGLQTWQVPSGDTLPAPLPQLLMAPPAWGCVSGSVI